MVMKLNLKVVCQKLKAEKPPYRCPVESCCKVYKSYGGIQMHLYKLHCDHAQDSSCLPFLSGAEALKNHQPIHKYSAKKEPDSSTGSQSMLKFKANGGFLAISETISIELVDKKSKVIPHSFSLLTDVTVNEKLNRSTKRPVTGINILEEFMFPVQQLATQQNTYHKYVERTAEEMNEEVEYDIDEEDSAWLDLYNEHCKKSNHCEVSYAVFELAMDRLEKESYFLPQSPSKNDHLSSLLIDEDAVCAICWDGECQNSNAILFCDMCNLAVHQDCYGVPLIPVSEWLCQRCLHSPSRAVSCCLCPNKGGAFKLTDCGQWAHVVCALWIPEVTFANTVYLEPIENIKQINPARWSLPCYICKQRRHGACIQCLRQHCRASFHVTCAQQAGLYMRIIPVSQPEENEVSVSKIVFCHAHAPAGENLYQPMITHSFDYNDDDDDESRIATTPVEAKATLRKEKINQARIILAEKRKATPTVSIPVLFDDALSKISAELQIENKEDFLNHLKGYWTLKRQSRNGVPLLRRLQINHKTGNQLLEKENESSKTGIFQGKNLSVNARVVLTHNKQLLDLKDPCDLDAKRRKLNSHSFNEELVKGETCVTDSKELKPHLSSLTELNNSSAPFPFSLTENSACHSSEVPSSSRIPCQQVEEKAAESQKTEAPVPKDNILIRFKLCKCQEQSKTKSHEKSQSGNDWKENTTVFLKNEEQKHWKKMKLDKKKKLDKDFEQEAENQVFYAKYIPDSKLGESYKRPNVIFNNAVKLKSNFLGKHRKKIEENVFLLSTNNKEVLGKQRKKEKRMSRMQKIHWAPSEERVKTHREILSYRLPDTSFDETFLGKTESFKEDKTIEANSYNYCLEKLKKLQHVRQGLERVRLLIELIQKREKQKLAEVHMLEKIVMLQVKPFALLLHRTLKKLEDKDKRHFFAKPVSTEEVPDYLDYIHQPMDFSTMQDKIDCHQYRTVDEFQFDFNLVISNCMTYNAKGTIYYAAAGRLRDKGNPIIKAAKKAEETADYNPDTGLHLENWANNLSARHNSWNKESCEESDCHFEAKTEKQLNDFQNVSLKNSNNIVIQAAQSLKRSEFNQKLENNLKKETSKRKFNTSRATRFNVEVPLDNCLESNQTKSSECEKNKPPSLLSAFNPFSDVCKSVKLLACVCKQEAVSEALSNESEPFTVHQAADFVTENVLFPSGKFASSKQAGFKIEKQLLSSATNASESYHSEPGCVGERSEEAIKEDIKNQPSLISFDPILPENKIINETNYVPAYLFSAKENDLLTVPMVNQDEASLFVSEEMTAEKRAKIVQLDMSTESVGGFVNNAAACFSQ